MSLIWKSPVGVMDIPEVSFTDLLFDKLKRYGDCLLTDATTGDILLYHDIERLSRQVALALQYKYGVQPDDVITISSFNCVNFFPAFFGIIAAGATVNTVIAELSAEDHAVRIGQLKPVALFCHPDNEETAHEVAEKVPSIKNIFVLGDAADDLCISWSQLLEDGQNTGKVLAPIEDLDKNVLLAFSSGTTGMPKVIAHSHQTLLTNVLLYSHPKYFPYGKSDIVMGTSSATHVYCLVIVFLNSVMQGTPCVILKKFDFEVMLKGIEKYKVSVLATVPFVCNLLFKDPRVDGYDLRHLRYVISASSTIPAHLGPELKNKLKLDNFVQLFGQTEIPAATGSPLKGLFKPTSIGVPAPSTEMKIVDTHTGEMLGPYQKGEMLLRGPQIMKGYYRNPKATNETINEEGWILTGDICYYDEAGYLYLVDRLKEFIKYQGQTISPAEVEAVLQRSPMVRDSCVIGLPHEDYGQVIHAVVVLAEDHEDSTEEDIINYMEKNAPARWQLKGGVTFVKSIPRNSTGKVVRKEALQLVMGMRNIMHL